MAVSFCFTRMCEIAICYRLIPVWCVPLPRERARRRGGGGGGGLSYKREYGDCRNFDSNRELTPAKIVFSKVMLFIHSFVRYFWADVYSRMRLPLLSVLQSAWVSSVCHCYHVQAYHNPHLPN